MSRANEDSGKRPARAPEKPGFTRTCNLLSRYMKEKGGQLGDLMRFDMTCNVGSKGQSAPLTMELFPQEPGLSHSAASKDYAQKAARFGANESGTQTAPMTIFYREQVFVFKDLPIDKAREIMALASQGCSRSIPGFKANMFDTQIAPSPSSSNNHPVDTPNVIPRSGNPPSQGQTQSASASNARDLPIMRRASLHRFLEKRKDRVIARAPYQVNDRPEAGFSEPAAGSKSWLRLATEKPL